MQSLLTALDIDMNSLALSTYKTQLKFHSHLEPSFDYYAEQSQCIADRFSFSHSPSISSYFLQLCKKYQMYRNDPSSYLVLLFLFQFKRASASLSVEKRFTISPSTQLIPTARPQYFYPDSSTTDYSSSEEKCFTEPQPQLEPNRIPFEFNFSVRSKACKDARLIHSIFCFLLMALNDSKCKELEITNNSLFRLLAEVRTVSVKNDLIRKRILEFFTKKSFVGITEVVTFLQQLQREWRMLDCLDKCWILPELKKDALVSDAVKEVFENEEVGELVRYLNEDEVDLNSAFTEYLTKSNFKATSLATNPISFQPNTDKAVFRNENCFSSDDFFSFLCSSYPNEQLTAIAINYLQSIKLKSPKYQLYLTHLLMALDFYCLKNPTYFDSFLNFLVKTSSKNIFQFYSAFWLSFPEHKFLPIKSSFPLSHHFWLLEFDFVPRERTAFTVNVSELIMYQKALLSLAYLEKLFNLNWWLRIGVKAAVEFKYKFTLLAFKLKSLTPIKDNKVLVDFDLVFKELGELFEILSIAEV